MVKNDEEVLTKLDELEKETSIYIKVNKKSKEDIKQKEFNSEELGLNLKIPKNYIISKEEGIVKVTVTETTIKKNKISPIPIVINKILKSMDTEEENIELAFYRRGKWEKIIVNKNTIYNTQNIITLANKGIPVTSINSKDLINWLYKLEVENYNDLKIEYTINRFGWVDNTTFVPFRSNNIQLKFEPGISTWVDKINKKKGSIESWKANMLEFLKDDETGLIRFTLAAGFSSCLLHIIGMRGTIINIYGPSGIGKTSLIELVNSIYGPTDNIISFSATPISVTILSERLSGIGLIIDEKQASLNDSKIPALLYSLAEGRTRLKATKDSDLISNKKFEINVIASAEEQLNEQSHTGASRRTIEIYTNKIFSSDKMSRKARKASKKDYGFAGEIFVNKLIDEYSENEYKEIIEKYENIEAKINSKLSKNVVASYVQSISVIILADILMNKAFKFGFNEESSIELGIRILNQLQREEDIDEVERAKEIIENWLVINDSRFDRQSFTNEFNNIENVNEKSEILENGSNSIEKYGMYQDGIYYIFPLKFNELIRQNKLSPNKIRRGFAEKGYIKIDEVNNRFTVNKFYNGGNRRMVAYKLENERKRLEREIEGKIEDNILEAGYAYKNYTYDEIIKESEIEELSNYLDLGIERSHKENE